jgi:hypothetical protein
MRDDPADSVRASLLTSPGSTDRSERRFLGGDWLRDLVSKARNFVETLLMRLEGNRAAEQSAISTFFFSSGFLDRAKEAGPLSAGVHY